MSLGSSLKKFWDFLKEDTWQSWIVSLILIVVFIKFIFFPSLSFITGTPLPLVVVESCSMYHETSYENWWSKNAAWYEANGVTKENFDEFPFRNGLNKGDIIAVWGRSEPEIGDIIIFQPNPESTAQHPIIHRVIGLNPIETKGDHNTQQLVMNNNPQRLDETNIPQERVIGHSVFRIPYVGWIKLIFFEPLRPESQRGFCS